MPNREGWGGGGSNDKALNMPDSHIHKTTTRSAGWLVAWPWVVSVVAWLSFTLGKEHQNIRAKESRELKWTMISLACALCEQQLLSPS